jgi:hypothetical protein
MLVIICDIYRLMFYFTGYTVWCDLTSMKLYMKIHIQKEDKQKGVQPFMDSQVETFIISKL